MCIVCIPHVCSYPWGPKEGIRCPGARVKPGAGVKGSCKLFNMSPRNKLKSSEIGSSSLNH